MADAISPREKRLWIAVAFTTAALFASLYPLQFVLDALRERNLLRLSVGAVFLVASGAVLGWMWHRRARAAEWGVLALSAILFAAVALSLDVAQERLHLVEYGGLALLLRAAFAERRRAAGWFAFAAAGAIGWADEIVQGMLPNRHYDPRDIGFNLLAAALALVSHWGLARTAGRRTA